MYTELDLRLGFVQLTPEQERFIDERVIPILLRAAKRAMPRLLAEQIGAGTQIPKGARAVRKDGR